MGRPRSKSTIGGVTSHARKEGFRVLRMKTLATGKETGGSFELVEDLRNEGEGPAPHIHRNSEEAFYVLEGRFTFTRGVRRRVVMELRF